MVRLRRRRDATAGAPGDGDDAKVLRWCRETVAGVRALGPAMSALADADLPPLTQSLRDRHARGELLDDLLPEAFAAVAEAAARALGQRPFDVQVMGAAALHLGRITEMRTGEGKTLTATMPAYLHALTGRGVHVMTANAYLAARDAEWMAPADRLLGLETGLVDPAAGAAAAEHRQAYAADVTYGSWDEFCHDYLRDNMCDTTDHVVQRGLHSVIADEADFILLDRMRAALSISVPAKTAREFDWPTEFVKLAAVLQRGEHYEVDEIQRTASLTDSGARAVEGLLRIDNLYSEAHLRLVYYLEAALTAKECYHQGRDYIIADGAVQPVDQATGRPRAARLTDGIHEAIEAKEGMSVGAPRVTQAAIVAWDYLAQYERLAGMTGTAQDDAATYRRLYQREVLVVPTNRPVLRVDHADVFYPTGPAAMAAVAAEALRASTTGQPVLIGVRSAPESAEFSGLLTEAGVSHEVLTAENPGQEARIMAGAGPPFAVTVAAQMAGRGVDIVLGGPDGSDRAAVVESGGLCVLGSGRPDQRRAEMHLRGRAGRQGDPGESKFFVSLTDDVVRAAAGSVASAISRRLQVSGELPEMSRGLTRYQRRVSAAQAGAMAVSRAFDQVQAEQRRVIYAERAALLSGADVRAVVRDMIDRAVRAYVTEASGDDLLPDRFWPRLLRLYPATIGPAAGQHAAADPLTQAELARIAEAAVADAQDAYTRREAEVGADVMPGFEQQVMLRVLDRFWREHLMVMTDLLAGIFMRTTGDAALAEYRRDGALAFARMREAAGQAATGGLFTLKTVVESEPD